MLHLEHLQNTAFGALQPLILESTLSPQGHCDGNMQWSVVKSTTRWQQVDLCKVTFTVTVIQVDVEAS